MQLTAQRQHEGCAQGEGWDRSALLALRTLVDPNNSRDVAHAHTLQGAVVVRKNSHGWFEIPNWDEKSDKRFGMRSTVLGATGRRQLGGDHVSRPQPRSIRLL